MVIFLTQNQSPKCFNANPLESAGAVAGWVMATSGGLQGKAHRLGAEMLPLESNRPRCFHRGLQPTGNPQSENSGRVLGANTPFFKSQLSEVSGHD